ncbi:MAG: LptA/OstA family protein, partial [Bdellovibrionales bacterium]
MKPLLNNTYGLYALIGFAAVFSLITPVNAQDITNSKEPLEITADGSLEWHRAQKRFIAIKNVQATQGDTSITAQTLTADYTDGKDNGFQISEVTADTDVIITARDSAAYGDHGIYNLKTGLATLTGQNLKAVSPDQTVTAQEKFEYFVPQGKLNAIGNAKAVRPDGKGGTNTLAADMLTATLKENAEGKRVLDTLEAKGNVVIITATERVTGTYG